MAIIAPVADFVSFLSADAAAKPPKEPRCANPRIDTIDAKETNGHATHAGERKVTL
jgi:hypothetical protein